ncbi:unnamed protein product [Blepharisma stoltei]|uniref:Uncharacterized protein n=1 Tax=Blepharisma stoltei TaxID=1481888 RepID=A0AAU9KB73_9CILI|nr:unnamed protein product [Blepharisma stoltei]
MINSWFYYQTYPKQRSILWRNDNRNLVKSCLMKLLERICIKIIANLSTEYGSCFKCDKQIIIFGVLNLQYSILSYKNKLS